MFVSFRTTKGLCRSGICTISIDNQVERRVIVPDLIALVISLRLYFQCKSSTAKLVVYFVLGDASVSF